MKLSRSEAMLAGVKATGLLGPVPSPVFQQTPCAMNALESVVLRVRETEFPVTQLHISAPVALIEQMICEFTAGGETPEIDDEVVEFGPYISVHPDDDLPSDCFKIAVQK